MAVDDELPDKVRKLMVVEYGAGGELSPSHKSEGGFSPLVHGANGVDEQAVLFDYDDKESNTAGQILVALGIVAVTAATTVVVDRVVVPRVKRWWSNWRNKTVVEEPSDGAPSIELDAQTAPGSGLADQVRTEVEASTEVTSEQWFQLLFDAIAHGAAGNRHNQISAERWGELATAHVVDDPEIQSLANAMRELSPEEISERIDRALEAHPELAREDPESIISTLLGNARDPQPNPIPLTSDDIPCTVAVEDRALEGEDSDEFGVPRSWDRRVRD